MNQQKYSVYLKIILACLILGSFAQASLVKKDKENLAKYALKFLDEKATDIEIKKIEESLKKSQSNYEYLYLTFFKEGDILCSKGLPQGKNPLSESIKKIINKCLEEKKIKKSKEKFDLVFHFLKEKKEIKSKDIKEIKKSIAMGVHGFQIENQKKLMVYGGSLPMMYEVSLEETLVDLCLKIKLKKNCYKDKETKIYRYDTDTFKVNQNLEVVDLYRYNILNNKNINVQHLVDAIKKTEAWYFNHVNPETGLLEHVYFPGDDDYGDLKDHLGHMGSALALLEAQSFTKNKQTPYLVHRMLDYYLGYLFTLKDKKSILPKKVTAKDSTFVLLDGKGKLSYNAFLLYSLVRLKDYPNQQNLVRSLSQGILDQQRKDGSYKTYFACDQDTEVNKYPGEAMLSLLLSYEETQKKEYLDSVSKGFGYYRDYWRKNKNMPFVPRHTQVYSKLYKYTKNKDVADFVFEMNDWLVKNHQVRQHEYKDMVGGFSKENPDSHTSLYANGINDAYNIAVLVKDIKRQSFYKDSLRAASHYILQTQYTPQNSFYLRASDKAVGGFRGSLLETEERSDEAFQALRALIKTADNKIF